MSAARVLACLALTASACTSAASNPDREKLRPVGAETIAELAAAEDAVEAELGRELESEPGAVDAVSDAEATPEAWARAVPLVAVVGDREIELSSFLERLWMRENRAMLDVLEMLVVRELALFETDRLGLSLTAEVVDAMLEDAYAGLRAQLAEAGSELTVDEHIRQNLEMDPAFYHTHLRDDAIVQLLLQRCVRAWALESGRAEVEVLNLTEEEADAFRGGSTFDALAEANERGAERVVLIRAERNEVARLAFATPMGEVGGPLVIGGATLLVRVLDRQEGLEGGDWSETGETVMASLTATPVDEDEFMQWRASMNARYRTSRVPLFELVGDPGP
jgi:hypothetical protein